MRRILIFLTLAALLFACDKKRPTGDPSFSYDQSEMTVSPGETVSISGTAKDPAGIAVIELSCAPFNFSKIIDLTAEYPNEYEVSVSFTVPDDATKGGDFVASVISYDNRNITVKLPLNFPVQEEE